MSIRSRILNRCFNLLYGPLVFLHEPAGVCLFGDSWQGRRTDVLTNLNPDGVLLDIGCGAGHLLERAAAAGFTVAGVDRSRAMLRRASRRGVDVIAGDAHCLPIATGSIASIVITYPGPWIRSGKTWAEIERVLTHGGSVVVLLGGTLDGHGGTALRRILIRLAYGSGSRSRISFEPPLPENSGIAGCLNSERDRWGAVYRWEGTKR